MSKASKNRQRIKRLSDKRGKKAAENAKYESWAREGKNNKSKRQTLRGKRTARFRTNKHASLSCGNPGCEQCFPDFAKPTFDRANKKPYQTSKQKLSFTVRFRQEQSDRRKGL